MTRVTLGVAALFCFIAVTGNAQKCKNIVKLNIVETHDFSPVHPAVVYIEELKKAFETDENGVVIIDSICDGSYTTHIHASGYSEKESVITITGNKPVRIKVDYDEHALNEVTIAGEHANTILQSKDQLDKDQLNKISGKTLADMLQNINGVSTLSNGATIMKPVIHGLHSNRIVMLNNGIRQEDQQWGSEHAPNIDPFIANNVIVLKGAAGVRYGTDAIGGVVLVEPKPLRTQPGWDGELNVGGFSNNRMGVASLMIEHTFKKIPALSFRAQGSYKKGGNYRIPGYWIANTGLEEKNYSATLAYRKLHYGAEIFYSHFNTDLGIYTGSHTGNEKDRLNAINSPTPLIPAEFTYDIGRPKQHVVHDLVKAKLYADNRLGTWNLIYGYQHNFRQEYDILRKENGRAQLNLTLQTHTINLNLDHKPVLGLNGQIGVDLISQDNRFQDGDRVFIPTYQSMGGAGYLIEKYQLKKVTIEGGLRFDYRWYGVYNPEGPNQQPVYYEFNYNNISGTLGMRHQLKDNWEWSATLANSWRAPQANELFSAGLHHGAARIELGNKNLQPERSYSLNVETNYSWNEKLHANVSLYSQLINDYIYLEPGADLLTIRGYFKTFNFKQTNAWLNGADVSLLYNWNTHWQSSLKGSLLRARDRTKNDWLILMPSDRISFSSKYTHSFSERFKDCFAELGGKYVFEQRRIPGNFDSIDYPRPPAGYFLLDASIGLQSRLGRQPINVSLAATNLLNNKYRDYLDVFRYFIDQPGTNIALRINVPFQFN